MRHHTSSIEERAESIAYKAYLDCFGSTGDLNEANKIYTDTYNSSIDELKYTQIEEIIFERRYDAGKKRAGRNNNIQRKN